MDDNEIKGVLFILKESLIDNGDLAKNFKEVLKKIITILNENTDGIMLLYKWNFLEQQIPYLLRSPQGRRPGFELATEILKIQNVQVPHIFLTKSFCFFLSELLSECMESSKMITDFTAILIKKRPAILNILYECGFFILVNSIITEDTANFYSVIFSKKNYENSKNTKTRIDGDIMYEIRRKHFDPEIVFGSSRDVYLSEMPNRFITSDQIYKILFDYFYNTSFFNFLDLGISLNLNVMNYCDWDFTYLCGSDDLRNHIIDSEYLAYRIYRKMLKLLCKKKDAIIEINRVEDHVLMQHVGKSIETKEIDFRYESVLILYYYYKLFNWNIEQKVFNENRIRLIFELLEYRCTNCRCMESCVAQDSEYSLQSETTENKNELSTMDTVYDECCYDCDKLKILFLLSKIYKIYPREYFFKPSYLVIMKVWADIFKKHSCHQTTFFRLYFVEFLEYLKKNTYNVSKILFSAKHFAGKQAYQKHVGSDFEDSDILANKETVDNKADTGSRYQNFVSNLKNLSEEQKDKKILDSWDVKENKITGVSDSEEQKDKKILDSWDVKENKITGVSDSEEQKDKKFLDSWDVNENKITGVSDSEEQKDKKILDSWDVKENKITGISDSEEQKDKNNKIFEKAKKIMEKRFIESSDSDDEAKVFKKRIIDSD